MRKRLACVLFFVCCLAVTIFSTDALATHGGAPSINIHRQPCMPGEYRRNYYSCEKCAEGTYTKKYDASSCNECSAGTYASGTGNKSCTTCPDGKYAPYKGASSCLSCPEHWARCDKDGTEVTCQAGYRVGTKKLGLIKFPYCYACGPGQYSATPAWSKCADCEKGTYSDGEANTSCKKCPDHYDKCSTDGKEITCKAGYMKETVKERIKAGHLFINISKLACTACPTGTYSVAGSTSCTKCPAGKYASSTGSSSCTSCAKGTYAMGEGHSSCEECPANTESCSADGTIKCKAGYRYFSKYRVCNKCEAGTYSEAGKSGCTECPAGTYSNKEASAKCTECAKGTYASGTGNTSCKALPKNATATKDKGADGFTCNSGFYKDGNECKACATGCSKCSDSSDNSCSSCQKGYLSYKSKCLAKPEHCQTAVIAPCPCNSSRACTQVCQTYVPTSTTCTACESGYALRNGKCFKNTVKSDGCAEGLVRDSSDGVYCKRKCPEGTEYYPATKACIKTWK